ncbi:unnamed protein product [Pocillopora meandrina]|uniref:Uncharacterized protein n=1 Tax=Pocillopora meandrina TaxID=46732 RepID=A0AAU9Y4N6_9CNID|nr:unnamed protein product [Pocillopora meandrina]
MVKFAKCKAIDYPLHQSCKTEITDVIRRISMTVAMEAMTVTLHRLYKHRWIIRLQLSVWTPWRWTALLLRSTSILSVLGQKMTTTELFISKKPVKSTHLNLSIQVVP